MTTVLSTPQTPAAPSSVRNVPTAVWAVMGGLALATAGLTGALVTRSIDGAPATATTQALETRQATGVQGHAASQQPMTAQLQQPMPLQQQPMQQQFAAGTPQVLPAQGQPDVPVRAPAKAAPARPQVQHAAPARPAPAVARAPAQPQWNPPLETTRAVETTRAAVCSSCGTIDSVQAVQEQGQGTGLGAVAGGVVGGLLGNQVGGGNGKKVMTVLGAVGGGFAGHEVEKRARATTAYDVQVRMEDGGVRSFRRAEPIAVGTRVVVDGGTFRVAQRASPAAAPRAIYTVAPADAGS